MRADMKVMSDNIPNRDYYNTILKAVFIDS